MSWLGDPAVLELKLIFSVLKQVEKFLHLIEKGKLDQAYGLLDEFEKDYWILLKCTGKELNLLKKEHLSRHCNDLVQILQKIFTIDYLYGLASGHVKLNQAEVTGIRALITKVLEAEQIIEKAITDIKFQEKQKKKALKLARERPKLSFQQKGCYHATNIRKLIKIFRKGIMSNISQKRVFGMMEAGIDTQQGHAFISVYDPYSFWRMKAYFAKKGNLDKVFNEEATPQDFRDFFDHNKDLNLSKFGARNIKTLFEGTDDLPEKVGIVNTEHIGVVNEEWDGVYHSRFNPFFASFEIPDKFTLNRLGKGGEAVLVIDDTAQLIPFHQATSIFELLFINKIPPKKIVGIAARKHCSCVEEILEMVKYLGLPLYDNSGVLVWPRE
jgi:hypothetical protein